MPSRAIANGREADQLPVLEAHAAAARRDQAHDGEQRGGLAHAVPAEERDRLPLGDLEGHVPEDGRLAVAAGQPLHGEHHAAAPPPQIHRLHLAVGADRLRRALGEDLAPMQHGDAVRDRHHHAHVVLDDDERHRGRQAAQEGRGLACLLRRHPGGGLVEQQELGLGGERHGDLDEAPVAVGHRAHEVAGAREQSHPRERRIDRARRIVPRDAEARERAPGAPHAPVDHERHVLAGGELGKDLRDLEGADHAEAEDGRRRGSRHVAPGEDDAARGRRQRPGDEVEEGGLARAVRADDRAHLAPRDGEADAVHRGEAAEAPRQLPRLEEGGARQPFIAGSHLVWPHGTMSASGLGISST